MGEIKMKKKNLEYFLLIFAFTLCFAFLVTPVLAIETYGWEDHQSGTIVQYGSKLKYQTAALYVDTDQGGVCPFGIWIYGRNKQLSPTNTRIIVHIYAISEYFERHIHLTEPWRSYEEYYWDPIPSDLVQWNGEYEYDFSSSGTWTFSFGGSSYDFTFSSLYTPNGIDSYSSANSISGDYRYLGYFMSQLNFNNDHKFHAFLQLHILNSLGKYWAEGFSYDEGGYRNYKKIVNIRFKLLFYYQVIFMSFWWKTQHQYNHIIGDGTPSTDLNYIPLTVGEAGPIEW